ncbi:Oligopeptide transport ATP-binding protein OppD [compost metagenome]
MTNLLEINHLRTGFNTDLGEVVSIDDISFSLKPGETIGIVGESGCGKSVTSLSIMRLLGKKGRIINGSLLFNGTDLAQKSESDMRDIRGNEISMIFQEPMTSLNPVFTIGHQMIEGIRLHLNMKKKEAKSYAVDMLRKVGIPRPEVIIDEYPHKLSGGMRQRVMIAMALSCKPKLLIADEPTTALDVTIQAQILELMKSLREESGTAIMLITHDLGVIAEMADKVIVMYAGQVVEETDVFTLFKEPKHPYTQALMRSIPHLDLDGEERLASIPGTVPSLMNMPSGCRFFERCPLAEERCLTKAPPLAEVEVNHKARCWLVHHNE